MYYQNYEDYMRSVLGYPVNTNNTYDNYNSRESSYQRMQTKPSGIEESMYPDIYKLINPIVCRTCSNYTENLTEENLEKIVDDIYKQIELNNEIMVKINIDNRSPNTQNVSRINSSQRNNSDIENRQRKPNNSLIRDLIKILILNQILGGHNRPPFRPPFPPPKPPHHGGVMPIRNTEYNNYFRE